MASVFASNIGLSVGQISTFVATFYVGALLMQYPIGWLSDRMDRRVLIGFVSAAVAAGALFGFIGGGSFEMLLLAAFVIGGTSNPLYALIIAHTNDFLEHEDMAAASGGLVFVNGMGAIFGPIITGWVMGVIGPFGFFIYMMVLATILAGYAAYRMTQRPTAGADATSYAPILQSATTVAMEAAQEVYIENELEDESNTLEQAEN